MFNVNHSRHLFPSLCVYLIRIPIQAVHSCRSSLWSSQWYSPTILIRSNIVVATTGHCPLHPKLRVVVVGQGIVMWVCLPLSPHPRRVYRSLLSPPCVLWSATGVGLTNRKALVDTHAYLFLATLLNAHLNFVLRLTDRDGTLKHVCTSQLNRNSFPICRFTT